MYRFIKLAVPVLALGMFAFVPSMTAHAADAPAASQPSAKGSITINVVDPTGAAVTGATVNIMPPMVRGAGARGQGGQGAARPQPVATGTTDDKGNVTITDVPVGKYTATVRVQGTGNGRADIEITEKAAAAPTNIKLAAPRARNGGNGGGNGGNGGGNGAGNGN